jgi:hypothetical protein
LCCCCACAWAKPSWKLFCHACARQERIERERLQREYTERSRLVNTHAQLISLPITRLLAVLGALFGLSLKLRRLPFGFTGLAFLITEDFTTANRATTLHPTTT